MDIEKTMKDLKSMAKARQFRGHINYIRFPVYKNMEYGARIDFDHPITALIGPNGTNKSSILRALQGCPSKASIGDYWFETSLDPIDEEVNGKLGSNRFIYSYTLPDGKSVEVIKQRQFKEGRGPDYFETQRPRIRDGMPRMPAEISKAHEPFRNKSRWSPVDQDVVYLDFRSELPAYEILMNFDFGSDAAAGDRAKKKDRVRRSANHLKKALEGGASEYSYFGVDRLYGPAEYLKEDEVAAVSRILDRSYRKIGLVEHSFFLCRGFTAYMVGSDRQYSEAFAGSGEFAAIMLVRAISRAQDGSLILLDEPETSLHPGAQTAFLQYIADMVKRKKLQVVMATHSPFMVDALPDESRKLLGIKKDTGRVAVVSQAATKEEAFIRVGGKLMGRAVAVEDRLAKILVERAAKTVGSEFYRSFNVQVVPGGAETLLSKVVPVEARLGDDTIILLDGDKRPKVGDSISLNVRELTREQVVKELKDRNLGDSHLIRSGGNDDDELLLDEARRVTLEWLRRSVGFLPGCTDPDALLLEMLEIDFSEYENSKLCWKVLTQKHYRLSEDDVTSDKIFAYQEYRLGEVNDGHPVFGEIVDQLRNPSMVH